MAELASNGTSGDGGGRGGCGNGLAATRFAVGRSVGGPRARSDNRSILSAAPRPALSDFVHTRFVLIEPSHAGNVGAAARALKVMGFDELVLVAPRWANVLRRQETIQRASGALDVLARARIVATLDEALDGVQHLCATAMTPRDFGPPNATPRAHFESLLKSELEAQELPAPEPDSVQKIGISSIAFLFGCERFGMANDDVYRCHVALTIPTNPAFGSLNLAAAVQVIAYEWRLALGGFAVLDAVAGPALPAAADARAVAGMLAHWSEVLVEIGFLDPAAPKKLLPRLQQIANRARLTANEIHILRGIAKTVRQAANRSSA